jgi:FkbM family methyltransferase
MLAAIKNLLFSFRHVFRGVPVRIGGYPMRIDERLRRWNFDAEAVVQAAFKKVIRPGDVVLDIGANFGLHTLLGAQIIGPAGRVFAFEPAAANLHLLRRNVRLNGFQDRVSIIPSAVSDSTQAQLPFSIPSAGLSVTAFLATEGNGSTTHMVPNVRLDDYRDLLRPARFIKIDVEGAELGVLKGAEGLVSSDRPVILAEVHVYAFEKFGTSLDRWRQCVERLGYRETALTPRNYGGLDCYHALLTPEEEAII